MTFLKKGCAKGPHRSRVPVAFAVIYRIYPKREKKLYHKQGMAVFYACRSLLFCLSDKFPDAVQRIQGLPGRHGVWIQGAQKLVQRAFLPGKKRHLPGRRIRPGTCISWLAVPLDFFQNRAGPADDRRRHTGQRGHLNAVAPAGAPFDQLVQKDDALVWIHFRISKGKR